jgi:hypothetical protein
MAPTTVDVLNQVSGPSDGFLRLTTSDGTEVNMQFLQESLQKPLFIRRSFCNYDSGAERDTEPAKLDIPSLSFTTERQTCVRASELCIGSGDDLSCQNSQCSTQDPNEEASPPLSPRSVSMLGDCAEMGLQQQSCVHPLEYSFGIPTKGSVGHYVGKCKPCAFVFKGGCESGVLCEFCHLCPPGEKIRRKKERNNKRQGRMRHTQLDVQREMQYEMQCQAQILPSLVAPPRAPLLQDSSEAWQVETSQAGSCFAAQTSHDSRVPWLSTSNVGMRALRLGFGWVEPQGFSQYDANRNQS